VGKGNCTKLSCSVGKNCRDVVMGQADITIGEKKDILKRGAGILHPDLGLVWSYVLIIQTVSDA